MGTETTFEGPSFKYHQLASLLEQQIQSGALKPGEKLPSIRALASRFQVAKNTAIHALHLMESKGLIDARAKSGFVVSMLSKNEPPTVPVFQKIAPSKVSLPQLLQDVLLRGAAFDIVPSEPAQPVHPLLSKLHRNINRQMRSQAARKVMYYDEPQGNLSLREQIASHYAHVGVMVSASELVVTAGCQHALFLALMATCKTGDNVIIESPGFYGVIQLLDQLGLHAIEVPSHASTGIDMEVLQSTLEQFEVAACVVSPTFSTPSGACMPDNAKQTLVDLSQQHDFALIEDDIYGDLGFDERPLPLKWFDKHQRVILCSSFSKSLSRDLRIGWIMGARWQGTITRLKLVSQLASNQSVQQGLSTFLQEGDYRRYLRHTQTLLAGHRQQWVNLLQQIWGPKVKFVVPRGGLSIWVELPVKTDTMKLYHQALEKSIVITPGNLFCVEQDFSRFLRLSFFHPLTPNREKALMALSKLGAS